jgi:hypothetical protein
MTGDHLSPRLRFVTTPPRLPLALQIVAWLFLFDGIGAVITIFVCMLHNQIQLDFDVLGIFVFFGLRRLSGGWRTCALVLVYLCLVLIPVVAIISLGAKTANVHLLGIIGPSIPPFFVTLAAIFWFGIALWVLGVLKRRDVVALFAQRKLGLA